MDKNFVPLIERLKKLLTDEKSMLMAGDAPGAASLISEKMDAMQALEVLLDPSPDAGIPAMYQGQVQSLVALSIDNSILFQAVQNGLKSMMSRLDRMDRTSQVGAYNQHGDEMNFRRATGSYVKRI